MSHSTPSPVIASAMPASPIASATSPASTVVRVALRCASACTRGNAAIAATASPA